MNGPYTDYTCLTLFKNYSPVPPLTPSLPPPPKKKPIMTPPSWNACMHTSGLLPPGLSLQFDDFFFMLPVHPRLRMNKEEEPGTRP